MTKSLQFAVSAALFLGVQFTAVNSAFAQPYECKYENGQEESYIEFDPATGMYGHPIISPSEENHGEGSRASEAKFFEDEGAVAAVVHVLGIQQGETPLEGGDTYLLTFHMAADGNFVEVFDGEVKRGTCKRQQAEAEGVSLTHTASISGNPLSHPWDSEDTAIVLDPYQGNSIDWDKVTTDPRVAGIIHKASEGLKVDGKYAERKNTATRLGYSWGSYHLLTNANAKEQIEHYLKIVGNDSRETHAVDIECLANSSSCQNGAFKVSFATIEAAMRHMKEKTGYYPLLYVNHSVATSLSARWRNSSEFADVRLWYARYKNNVVDFPKGPWERYTLWQFSSEINCDSSSCPYRVRGTKTDMDVNVYFGTPEQLKSKWPLER